VVTFAGVKVRATYVECTAQRLLGEGSKLYLILTEQRAWSTATWPALVLQGIISTYIILIMWDYKKFPFTEYKCANLILFLNGKCWF
jgi:hypothetical protein